MTFPLPNGPAWHTFAVWTLAGSKRNAIHYTGDDVTISLTAAGPTAYSVRDVYGNLMTSGTMSATAKSVDLGSSWNPGWYRVYFTGPNTDPTYGTAYADTCFVVFPVDTRFPANPAGNVSLPQTGAQGPAQITDNIMNAVIGTRSPRGQVFDASNTAASPGLTSAMTNATFARDWWTGITSTTARLDTGRPTRRQFLQFTNLAVDEVKFVDGGGNTYLEIFVKTPGAVNPANLYVQASAGTTAGTKVRVFYPNNTTLVETFDNLTTSPIVTINATSNYIFASGGGASSAVAAGPTAIGTLRHDGVVASVQALWPLGITHFEGPLNEPSLSNIKAAQLMKIFQATVHEANPDAKAIGPSSVDMNLSNWNTFLSNGGGNYCDEISFHGYNFATNGDLNLGRNSIETFQALLASYGQQNKTLWMTEGGGSTFIARYGVMHPRSARVPILTTLLWEQYGLERERNLQWYDRQHGFWGFPQFMMFQDNSLVPVACMFRTLCSETFGMRHNYRVDFGHIAANAIFLGSVYSEHPGSLSKSCLVVQPTSFIDNCQVTFTISGTTAAIQSVDGLGNVTALTQSSGRVVLPLTEFPSYLRLPAGVTASVYSVNDWGPTPNPPISAAATATVGGVAATAVNDYGFMTSYIGSLTNPGVFYSSASLPDTCQLIWGQNVTVDRVVIWCGQWQSTPALVDFDVDTWDGATWTTRVTKTRTDQVSFAWAGDGNTTGCSRETWAPDVWVEDIALPSPVSALGVRINVRALTYGGEPDGAATAAGGQGMVTPKLAIQEMMAFSNTTIAGVPPINTVAPVVTGTTTLGTVLSCSQGTWTNKPGSYGFQWYRAGTPIGGATAPIYTKTLSDVGQALSCLVTATTAGVSASQASSNSITPAISRMTVGVL